MILVRAAYALNTFQGSLVANLTTKCVAGIGWIDDDSPVANDPHGLANQAQLRIVWMDLEKLAHKPFALL